LLYSLNQRSPFAPADGDLRVPQQVAQAANDNELCVLVVDHLWHSLPPSPKIIGKIFGGRISQGQLISFATSWLCREIAGGGFAQFFENPAGDLGAVALHGLEQIGAAGYANILRRAMRVFPGDYPASHEERVSHLKAHKGSVADQLDVCSREFWELLNSEDGLERYMATFIRNSPEQFLRAG